MRHDRTQQEGAVSDGVSKGVVLMPERSHDHVEQMRELSIKLKEAADELATLYGPIWMERDGLRSQLDKPAIDTTEPEPPESPEDLMDALQRSLDRGRCWWRVAQCVREGIVQQLDEFPTTRAALAQPETDAEHLAVTGLANAVMKHLRDLDAEMGLSGPAESAAPSGELPAARATASAPNRERQS